MTPIDHVIRIGDLLDRLSIDWVLGGSMASSIVGESRSTMDIDIALTLRGVDVERLVSTVRDEYYISADMVIDAVARRSSFNLIHYATGMKIDMFVLSDEPLDVRQMSRRRRIEITPEVFVWVGAADDQVLRKLRWFQMGGEVSDRQWRDVIAILRVQGDRIDHDDLLTVARGLGLGELATRAVSDATSC